ncbi:MAG: hypothetical protein ACJA0W_001138, partial [Candidatus Azotimanducaceae bacterium]
AALSLKAKGPDIPVWVLSAASLMALPQYF